MTSFAEKYGKKASFTSQNVLQKAQEKGNAITDLVNNKQAEAEKQIDPQAMSDLLAYLQTID